MTTAIQVLIVLSLIGCLLLLFPFYVAIIVGCCCFIFLCSKRISKEKRHPESAPSSHAAPLDQSDARLVRETRNDPDLEGRREILTQVEDLRTESNIPSIPCAGKEIILTIENEKSDTEKSKRHPESAPVASAATSDQADTHEDNVDKAETCLRKRIYPELTNISEDFREEGPSIPCAQKAILTIENENSDTDTDQSHPESAPTATAAADTHPDKVLEERKNQKNNLEELKDNCKTPSIPSPGRTILAIENKNADKDYPLKTIPSSIGLKIKTPVSIFKKASATEEETKITETTNLETPSISDPKTAILTIENEESDTDDSDSEKRINRSIEFKHFPPDSNVFLQSPSKASTKDETKESKTTQPLPLSTKSKHLYPKCNSAAQACR